MAVERSLRENAVGVACTPLLATGGALYRSIDGGVTWSTVAIDPANSLEVCAGFRGFTQGLTVTWGP